MDPLELRSLGGARLRLTALGCGGATLGDIAERITETQSDATLAAALDSGIAYFDTAPWYGLGKSEHRFGHVLRGRDRGSFVLSTKVGRILRRPAAPDGFEHPTWQRGLPFAHDFDYTAGGVTRSYEDSLQRLGLNRVDALLIHDLDHGHHGGADGVRARLDELDSGGGFAALAALRSSAEIQAIGVGINAVGLIPLFLDRFDIDFFLVAMPYTLLSQRGLWELETCRTRGIGIVIGAPFASGLLSRGPGSGATYGYRPADEAINSRAEAIAAVCLRHGVPLGAAALQFVLAHPAVASVIPGPNSPEQVRANLDWARIPIPQAMWDELQAMGLIEPDAPTPG